MLASGVHDNKDEPPAASMFTRGTKQQKQSESNDDVIVSVINSLCQAVTNKQGQVSTGASPAKRAQLRSTYIQQLSELHQLYDNEVLNEDEYEEQQSHNVSLMCELK